MFPTDPRAPVIIDFPVGDPPELAFRDGHVVRVDGARSLPYNPYARLERIAAIIEAVDNRCMAVDGPVTPTLREMTQKEISEIYSLASGQKP